MIGNGQSFVVKTKQMIQKSQSFALIFQQMIGSGQSFAVKSKQMLEKSQSFTLKFQQMIGSGQSFVVKAKQMIEKILIICPKIPTASSCLILLCAACQLAKQTRKSSSRPLANHPYHDAKFCEIMRMRASFSTSA